MQNTFKFNQHSLCRSHLFKL